MAVPILNPAGEPVREKWKPDPAQTKKFTPIGKLLHIQIVESSEQPNVEVVQGRLIIPDNVRWFTPVCYIIARGPKCEQVQEGDFIYMSLTVTTHELRFVDGTNSLVIHEDGIFGILTDEQRQQVIERTGWQPPKRDKCGNIVALLTDLSASEYCCPKETPVTPIDDLD